MYMPSKETIGNWVSCIEEYVHSWHDSSVVFYWITSDLSNLSLFYAVLVPNPRGQIYVFTFCPQSDWYCPDASKAALKDNREISSRANTPTYMN